MNQARQRLAAIAVIIRAMGAESDMSKLTTLSCSQRSHFGVHGLEVRRLEITASQATLVGRNRYLKTGFAKFADGGSAACQWNPLINGFYLSVGVFVQHTVAVEDDKRVGHGALSQVNLGCSIATQG